MPFWCLQLFIFGSIHGLTICFWNQLTFSKCQIDGEDFVKYCGLLRKHELHLSLAYLRIQKVLRACFCWIVIISPTTTLCIFLSYGICQIVLFSPLTPWFPPLFHILWLEELLLTLIDMSYESKKNAYF